MALHTNPSQSAIPRNKWLSIYTWPVARVACHPVASDSRCRNCTLRNASAEMGWGHPPAFPALCAVFLPPSQSHTRPQVVHSPVKTTACFSFPFTICYWERNMSLPINISKTSARDTTAHSHPAHFSDTPSYLVPRNPALPSLFPFLKPHSYRC